MSKTITAIAYPTIPIVFLGGITSERKPLYDTMGLAVTDLAETTRTETTIKLENVGSTPLKVNFRLNGQPITGLRGKQIISSIKSYAKLSDVTGTISVDSTNYNIYSGSSDSGLAALYTALNNLLDLNYSKDQLLNFAMRGSESAGRSLFGGLTLTKVSNGSITVEQIASAEALSEISLFSIPFSYESRVSADEIHAGIVTHEAFPKRVTKIPYWIDQITTNITSGHFLRALHFAEENIRNAHELLEDVGIHVRKPEMLSLCKLIQTLRTENDIPAYFLIGGGNLITIATVQKYAEAVASHLKKDDWQFYDFKIAPAPKLL